MTTTPFFEYSADGDGKKPLAFLEHFKGVWLSDGCSVYNLVCETNGLLRAGCWSHGRRKIFEARASSPAIFHAGISAIREIFMIERKGREDLELRKRLRAELVAPMVHDFFVWVRKERHTLEPDNPMTKALNYFVNQEVYLRRFLQHPEIAIHNNASEFQLRQPVVGRKTGCSPAPRGRQGGRHPLLPHRKLPAPGDRPLELPPRRASQDR